MSDYTRIQEKLHILYPEQVDETLAKLKARIDQHSKAPKQEAFPVSEQDVVLITYGDQVQDGDQNPLAVQHEFLKDTIHPIVNSVHLLPFFPYSSDDGFSVIDYKAVNPEHGTWDDITAMGEDFKLMFDAVFNHISAHSEWFQAFLRDEEPYREYFVVMSPDVDLSEVVPTSCLALVNTC